MLEEGTQACPTLPAVMDQFTRIGSHTHEVQSLGYIVISWTSLLTKFSHLISILLYQGNEPVL